MFMKNSYGSIAAVLVSLCIILGAQPVFAEDTETGQPPTEQTASVKVGKDFYLGIGLKVWEAEWQTPFTSAPGEGVHITTMTSKAQAVIIPSLSMRFKDVFISAGYFNTTKFDFQKSTAVVNFGPPAGFTLDTTTVSAKRTEQDANIGYFIFRSVALTAGYKQISQKYHTIDSSPGLQDLVLDSETKYTGPTFGLVASAPIGRGGFGLYDNFSYGQLKAQFVGDSQTDNATYISSELGFTYKAGVALLSAGYKYQALDTTSHDSKLIAPDVTKGFIFGFNLVF
jgi:hypothetical protein